MTDSCLASLARLVYPATLTASATRVIVDNSTNRTLQIVHQAGIGCLKGSIRCYAQFDIPLRELEAVSHCGCGRVHVVPSFFQTHETSGATTMAVLSAKRGSKRHPEGPPLRVEGRLIAPTECQSAEPLDRWKAHSAGPLHPPPSMEP